jgi:hypothetical protein
MNPYQFVFFIISWYSCKICTISRHACLPNAMVEPIPVLALIHATTTVGANISLLSRLILFYMPTLDNEFHLLSACSVLPLAPTITVSKLQLVSVRLARVVCALVMTILVRALVWVVADVQIERVKLEWQTLCCYNPF